MTDRRQDQDSFDSTPINKYEEGGRQAGRKGDRDGSGERNSGDSDKEREVG